MEGGIFPALYSHNREEKNMRNLALLFMTTCFLTFQCQGQHQETRWEVMPGTNADMVYMVQPNQDCVTMGVPFRTNELGFRDTPISPKTPQMLRILCVGDSVTFGSGVSNEETFPNVLERTLQQRARPGVTVDVINAGVSAYNIRNIRGQLQEYLSQLQPDIVVYVFVENDLDDSVSTGPNKYLAAYDPLKTMEEPFFGDDFAGMWLIRRQTMAGRGLLAKFTDLFDQQLEEISRLPPPLILGAHPEPTKRWKAFTAEFDRILSLCQQGGAKLLVYSFALSAHSEPIVLKVREICTARGIPEASTLPVFDYDTYTKTYSLGYDPHCNAKGHQVMADRLLTFLVESQSLSMEKIDLSLPITRYQETIDLEVARQLEAASLKGPEVIDFGTGSGVIGLLGGFDLNGKMGRLSLVRLGGVGNLLEVEAIGLTGKPDQPVSLEVHIEGHLAGTPYTLSTQKMIYSFPIPPDFMDKPIEVELRTQGPVWVPSLAERQQGMIPLAAQISRIKKVQGR
jgi:lysophospholipase L1-like esterase